MPDPFRGLAHDSGKHRSELPCAKVKDRSDLFSSSLWGYAVQLLDSIEHIPTPSSTETTVFCLEKR